MRILSVSAVLAALAIGSVSAQTVTVDQSAVADGTTVFNTITEAIISFEEVSREAIGGTTAAFVSDELGNGPLPPSPGPNAGNGAANVINITDFGPYDEPLPQIGRSGIFGNGVEADGLITINGDVAGTLILARDAGSSGSSIIVDGPTGALAINNCVIAQSATAVGNDDFFFTLASAELTLTDCVVTSLTASDQATVTGLVDIPADLLDGTRDDDPTLVNSGDNGGVVGLFGNATDTSVWTLNNTVFTQQGTQASNTGTGILPFGTGTLNINAGCVFSAIPQWALQLTSGGPFSTVNITGTADNRVVFLNNDGPQSGVSGDIIIFDPTNLTIDQVTSVNTLAGLIYMIETTGPTTIAVSNTLVVSAEADGFNFDNTSNTGNNGPITLDSVTIADVGDACLEAGLTAPAVTLEINVIDSIIAGPAEYGVAVLNGATVNLTNSALVNTTFAAEAITTPIPASGGTVNQTNVIDVRPDFASTAFSLAAAQDITGGPYYDVQNTLYAGAASGGLDLGGGADYVGGGLPVELSVFSAE